MSHIGSVFLGDVQRQQRIFGTPPSSPPGHPQSPRKYSPSPEPLSLPMDNPPPSTAPPLPKISSEVSLDLRVRWLETLLYGSKQDPKERRGTRADAKNSTTLVRGVEDLQNRLSAIVQTNEGLKRFIDHCESLISLFVWHRPQARRASQMNNTAISSRRPSHFLLRFPWRRRHTRTCRRAS